MDQLIEEIKTYEIEELENMMNIYYQKYLETRNDSYLMIFNKIDNLINQKNASVKLSNNFMKESASSPVPPNDNPIAFASVPPFPPSPPNDNEIAFASVPPSPPNSNQLIQMDYAIYNYRNSSLSSNLEYMLDEEEYNIFYQKGFISDINNLILYNNLDDEIIVIKGLKESYSYLVKLSNTEKFRDHCGRPYSYREFIKVYNDNLGIAYYYLENHKLENCFDLKTINRDTKLQIFEKYSSSLTNKNYYVIDFDNENIYSNNNPSKRIYDKYSLKKCISKMEYINNEKNQKSFNNI